ncbi:MAG: hypothetical protein R3Y22_07625 [Bacteroidales bacterium]
MDRRLFLSLALGSSMLFSSCSKKMAELSSDYFVSNPAPLTAVAGAVPAKVTANIPAKFFVKDAELEIVPVLVNSEGDEVSSNPYKMQGEKIRGNNPVISYEYGGALTIPASFLYYDAMAKSDLVLDFIVTQKDKSYTLPRVKIGEGVNATSTMVSVASITPAIAVDKFQRIINEEYQADIQFLVNQTTVRGSETNTAEMNKLKSVIKAAQDDDTREVELINVSSYASPEGGVKVNTKIAEGREQSTKEYLERELKNNDITDIGGVFSQFTPQDWEGFQILVAASDIQDKNLILSVLSMYKDPEQREKEIRNLSSVFEQLAEDVLPKLRKSRLTATISIIGKSDEELLAAVETEPEALTVDELLYAASIVSDNDKKIEIYTKAAVQYPNDYRAYNNLGACYYVAGEYKLAENNLNIAAKKSKSAEVALNLGLIAMVDEDYDKANEKFGEAAGIDEVKEALGVYYLQKGDYNAAVNAFGDNKSNNAALAQILVNDYVAARGTLAAIPVADANTYYITAILGARTSNNTMVYSNLKQAVRLDSSLAARATTDIEFKDYNVVTIL